MLSRAHFAGAMATAALAALTLAPVAVAQNSSQTLPAVVPAGVSVGGIDLGGMDAATAAAALEAGRERMQRDVVVRVAKHRYTLSAGQAFYSINIGGSVTNALRAKPGEAVEASVTYKYDNVRDFVKKIAKREYRKPRDARISIKTTKIQVAPHRVGRRIEINPVTREITKLLKDPALSRNLMPKRAAVKAKVTKGTLKKTYRTVLTADRKTFKLRLFKELKLRKTYSIAVGQAGHSTPPGQYTIANKTVNPAWHVPNSSWAGSLAGQVIPGGAPNNPLKARWLGIADGVGIHGTSEDWSIGTAASHGCLRMHVKDVIDLYPRVPVGTTILIK